MWTLRGRSASLARRESSGATWSSTHSIAATRWWVSVVNRASPSSTFFAIASRLLLGRLARLARVVDLEDQAEACRRVFASDTLWTVVRGSDLEEGESQGLPVWSRHVGDPVLKSNLTRRIDFALFMVDALTNDELVHEAPAIVGRQTPSALAHAD